LVMILETLKHPTDSNRCPPLICRAQCYSGKGGM
jgi:hypothetical protein